MSCPTCDGKGVLGGCGRDDCDHTHTLMFCPDCNPQESSNETQRDLYACPLSCECEGGEE